MFEQIAQSRLALGLLAALLAAASAAFFMGRSRAVALAGSNPRSLHSRPNYHGYLVALWTLGPSLAVLALYSVGGDWLADRLALNSTPGAIAALPSFEQAVQIDSARALASGGGLAAPDGDFAGPIRELAHQMSIERGALKLWATIISGVLAIAGLAFSMARIRKDRRARNRVESAIKLALMLCSGVAIVTTIGIVLSLVFETMRFFGEVSPMEFLFGLKWSAQTNIRPDQIGASGAFGAVPLIYGSLLITLIAMIVAAPVGLYAAIYLSEYAGPRTRRTVKPILEVLAGVPTVVYGFFALLTVAPAIRAFGDWLNGVLMWMMPWVEGPIINPQPTSALAAGLVMGVMIIPFVSSLSDDVINATPQTLRDGAFALGATKSETVKQVILPAALPGVVAALLLAVSRAIGETMIVVMAAGQRAQITADPFQDVTTITVQIVDLLTGDTEFDSPKTLSAFALGFGLFLITLVFNLIAQRVVKAYREKYE
ncbi:MAG: phosphate ABC transporter permease subunit PstC [Hyphomonadaceae bacterium]|nr:phosphate ABC transporter permease subunit PstC [Hyphomonadaceae bacterium]